MKNIGERIKKLANAKDTGLSINQLRVIVALERAVARLESETKLKDHIVFKGGFVLLKTIESARFTRDLDALAFDIDQDKASDLARKALEKNLKDNLWFVDIRSETIPDQGDYGGLRLNCAFQIGESKPEPKTIKKLSRIHIDIGFGDEIPKKDLKTIEMPSVLDGSPVSWHVYPLEFIFAEKLQTLIARGSANSRAKDVYDLVEIFPECRKTQILASAIRDVFEHRGTDLPTSFAETVKNLDIAILSGSWGSVDSTIQKPRFEEYWKKLIEILNSISSGD